MFRAYGSAPIDASTPWGLNFNNGPKGNLKRICCNCIHNSLFLTNIFTNFVRHSLIVNIDAVQKKFLVKSHDVSRRSVNASTAHKTHVLFYSRIYIANLTTSNLIIRNRFIIRRVLQKFSQVLLSDPIVISVLNKHLFGIQDTQINSMVIISQQNNPLSV